MSAHPPNPLSVAQQASVLLHGIGIDHGHERDGRLDRIRRDYALLHEVLEDSPRCVTCGGLYDRLTVKRLQQPFRCGARLLNAMGILASIEPDRSVAELTAALLDRAGNRPH